MVSDSIVEIDLRLILYADSKSERITQEKDELEIDDAIDLVPLQSVSSKSLNDFTVLKWKFKELLIAFGNSDSETVKCPNLKAHAQNGIRSFFI